MNPKYELTLCGTLLAVIDLQERLVPVMAHSASLIRNAALLIEGANQLAIPILATEQYPKGLGSTLSEITGGLDPSLLWPKVCFSCFDVPEFASAVIQRGCRTLILCGAETHVCVQMTALDALKRDLNVVIAADAVGSRSEENATLALALLRDAGAVISSTESILFSLLRGANHPAFKSISARIK